MSRTLPSPRSTVSLSLAAFALLAGTFAAACSDPPQPSGFEEGEETDGVDGPSGPLGGKDDGPSSQTPGEFESCATSSAEATLKPIHLVFMFDKSGSMVAGGSPKWSSAKAASKAFFESQQSAGLNASLAFFPANGNQCSAGSYAPAIPTTALPSTSFGSALDAQDPDGDTPTYVALQGAIDYAQGLLQNQAKDGRVAIVLVTDGMPDSNCSGSSIPSVKQLAASVAQTIPTYVIGVGDQLANLGEIAVGGGTQNAHIVPVNNPGQIQQDFTKAIETIKGSAMTCDYKIPTPSNGDKLDHTKVNVVYTPTGSAAETLSYNPTCTNGPGWRYDNEAAPTQIILCGTSCDNVKAKPGKVDVLFGCATKGGVN